MLDDIAQAVLAREEVIKYLQRDYGERGETRRRASASTATSTSCARPSGTRFTARCSIRSIPILRKIERKHENLHHVLGAVGDHRIVYASNHKSHTDYLVEPLVLDDNGIRPPLIAAGINLFGGPLGLIHRHVTGAIPIRRNTKDPAYLITLKAYVAEMLKKHDLFFYPEGGRSYSGELKAVKTGLIHAALTAGCDNLVIIPAAVAYDLVLEDHILARQRVKKQQRPVHAASWPKWCATRSATARARSSPSARRCRSANVDTAFAQRGARAHAADPARASARSTRCCRPRCLPRRCGRRSRGAISRSASTG